MRRVGAFVAGRLGFAGSLGIDEIVENGKGWIGKKVAKKVVLNN